MEEKTTNKSQTKFSDKTVEDRIWRTQINKANMSAKNWSEKWGFLSDFENSILEVKPKKDTTTTLNNDIKQLQQRLASLKPIPKTTSGEIGWRATDKILQLELYGSNARGKMTISKKLQWPEDSCD